MGAFDDYKSSLEEKVGKENFPYNPFDPTFQYQRYAQWEYLLQSLSADNPYLPQLRQVRQGSDAMDLLNAAIEYDADRRAAVDKAELDRILQAEQRAYDSPAQRIARERAAGLNPDLQGASGSGSGTGTGSGMVQSQPLETDLDPFQRGTEVAQTVFQGVSAVGSFFSGVTGAVSSAADLAFKISDWANAKQRSDASTATAQMTAARDRFNIVDTIAKSIPPAFDDAGKQIPITAAQITDAAKQLGLSEVGGIADFAEQYVQNPAVTSFYNKLKQQEKESYADLVGTQTAVLVETVQYQRAAKLFETQADMHLGNIKADVAANLAKDENFMKDQVRSQQFNATADAFESARRFQVAKRDFEAFTGQLKAIDSWVQRINKQIKSILESGHQNEDSNRLHLNTLAATKVNLVTLAGSKIDDFYDIILGQINKDAIWDSTHTSSGSLNPLALLQENPTLQFVNMYSGSNMSDQISAIETLFKGFEAFTNFKNLDPKTVNTTSNTVTIKNGKVVSESNTNSSQVIQ